MKFRLLDFLLEPYEVGVQGVNKWFAQCFDAGSDGLEAALEALELDSEESGTDMLSVVVGVLGATEEATEVSA